MPAGDVMPSEARTYTDSQTGASVRQLTDWRAHSHHLYFTNDGLWDAGRRLLIASERNNGRNLYSVDLAGGDMTQLTDFPPGAAPSLLTTFANPARSEAYFVADGRIVALDLNERTQRELFRAPQGFLCGNLSVTADGQTICHVIRQDLSARIRTDLQHGYVGFVETFEARPHCVVLGIPAAGGPPRVLHEDDCWIGHVNTSPTMPDRLTFCHEGPWNRLQRLWGLDIATGEAEPLRPQKPPEAIGHEYWFADGRRVGYHGWLDEKRPVWGFVSFDGSGRREWPLGCRSMHFHSIDETLFVGDGGKDIPYLLLWRLREGNVEGPRRLATHRGSFHTQILHVHPRMFRDADGRLRVLYTADHNGYGNVFLVDVPEWDALPVHEAAAK